MDHLTSIESKVINWSQLKDLIDKCGSKSGSPTLITYINPYTGTLIYNNEINHDNIDYFVLDGILATKLFNALNRKKHQALSFDFAHIAGDVFSLVESNSFELAIIGANSEELNIFVGIIKQIFPKLKISYTHDGYFEIDDEIDSIIQNLNNIQPHFIMLSLGSPKQELIGSILKNKLSYGAVIKTCGAFVSQTASKGESDYYPKFINDLGLRWLYRLYSEKHIRKRWIKFYPRFVLSYPCIKVKNYLNRFKK